MEEMNMTKTEIKNAENNILIVELVNTYAIILCKNGQRCKVESKKLNDIATELMNRGLLTSEDIEYLNN